MTGSSIFDFQGDGAAEAVYNDECYLRIYDGKTGGELAKVENPSWTWYEYPVVADVDRDGNSEIVVVANKKSFHNCAGYDQAPTKFGIKVFGDAHDKWVRTRPVWPQYHYHITDFELKDGHWNVPETEEANWLSYNNYRQNHQGGALLPLPDMTVALHAVPKCPNEILLVAMVQNIGSATAEKGVPLEFDRIDTGTPELVDAVSTTQDIMSGGFEMITASYENPPLNVNLQFRAGLNGDASLKECDMTNNESESEQVRCIEYMVE
ncbi:MAG: VCBS repeat-containing protein [Myxococcota bacterium]|nr:VCBS repeat-containing protein [Myxococcota bacterium]